MTKNVGINLANLKIQYNDQILPNPCLLALEIINVGNEAINDPPIKIRTDEAIEIIPGYFEDIPSGYENLWNFYKTDSNSCNIQLEHINPKQVVKTRFFLDNVPQKKISFECPMQNVQMQEVAYSNANITNKITTSTKSNIILISITVLLFVCIQQWSYYIDQFIWATGIHLHTSQVVVFIMILLVLTIVMNACGIPVVDTYIKSHPKQSVLIRFTTIIASIILLALIVSDYIIVHAVPQMIVAIAAIVLLSSFIHFSFILKNAH